jgi:lysozyme
MNMTYSARGLALTEQFEGLRLVAYKDSVGFWTIGYGHVKGVVPGQVCTPADADKWLRDDVQNAENAVNELVFVPLTQNQFDALVDFTFNLGRGALAGSTMLKLINASKFDEAAGEFVKWDHAGGVELPGLLRRRIAERDLFTSIN